MVVPFHINGIIQYVTFWDWYFAVSIIIWRCTQVAALSTLCSFYCSVAFHGVDRPLHVQPSTHLGCVPFGAVLNAAAVIIHVQDFVQM